MRRRFLSYMCRTIVLFGALGLVSLVLAADDAADKTQQVFREPPPKEITAAIEEGLEYLRHKYPLDLDSGKQLVLAFAVYRNRMSKYVHTDDIDDHYLVSLTPSEALQKYYDHRTGVKVLASHEMLAFGLSALPYLSEQIESTDGNVRGLTFSKAGYIMTSSEVFKTGTEEERSFCRALLIRCLLDTNPKIRAAAVYRLSRFRVESAVPEFIKLLDDESENVRINATRALISFGKKDVVPQELLERSKELPVMD